MLFQRIQFNGRSLAFSGTMRFVRYIRSGVIQANFSFTCPTLNITIAKWVIMILIKILDNKDIEIQQHLKKIMAVIGNVSSNIAISKSYLLSTIFIISSQVFYHCDIQLIENNSVKKTKWRPGDHRSMVDCNRQLFDPIRFQVSIMRTWKSINGQTYANTR